MACSLAPVPRPAAARAAACAAAAVPRPRGAAGAARPAPASSGPSRAAGLRLSAAGCSACWAQTERGRLPPSTASRVGAGDVWMAGWRPSVRAGRRCAAASLCCLLAYAPQAYSSRPPPPTTTTTHPPTHTHTPPPTHTHTHTPPHPLPLPPGVLPPSGGDALVYGESLGTPGGMDRIRSLMGVCPQVGDRKVLGGGGGGAGRQGAGQEILGRQMLGRGCKRASPPLASPASACRWHALPSHIHTAWPSSRLRSLTCCGAS